MSASVVGVWRGPGDHGGRSHEHLHPPEVSRYWWGRADHPAPDQRHRTPRSDQTIRPRPDLHHDGSEGQWAEDNIAWGSGRQQGGEANGGLWMRYCCCGISRWRSQVSSFKIIYPFIKYLFFFYKPHFSFSADMEEKHFPCRLPNLVWHQSFSRRWLTSTTAGWIMSGQWMWSCHLSLTPDHLWPKKQLQLLFYNDFKLRMKKMNEVCYYKLLFYVILLGKPSKNKKNCSQ